MNIFYLDREPRACASFHCDKHVVKMILETAQLLSTAHHLLDGPQPGLYKPTHKNHPSAIWIRSNIEHYRFGHDLLFYLCLEYTNRYKKIHKTQQLLPLLLDAPKNIPITDWCDPPQCMPDDCKQPDAVNAYRLYYAKYKSNFATWKTQQPYWWRNEEI